MTESDYSFVFSESPPTGRDVLMLDNKTLMPVSSNDVAGDILVGPWAVDSPRLSWMPTVSQVVSETGVRLIVWPI